MKKILILLGFIIIGFIAIAQKNPDVIPYPYPVPVDSITKKITYEGVVEVKGVSASDLFNRAHDWFMTFYKNPNEVIRTIDSVSHKIEGKPRFRLSNPADKEGTRTDAGITQYLITVIAKDGRFKYELTEFNWKQLSNFPAEKWLDMKSPSYTIAYNEYLQETDKQALEIIASLKKAVTELKPVKNKDNW